MKFFTVYEIINSIFFSAFSGVAFAGIYCASESIIVFIKEMLLIIPSAIKLLPELSFENLLKSVKIRKKISLNSIERNVFEAILFFTFGISLILISYAALDGYIRVYIFIVATLFFVLSRKYIGKIFSSVFARLFGAIYFITLIFVSVLLWPLYKMFKRLTAPLKRLVSPVASFIRKKRSSRILRSKLKEIRREMKLNT